MSETPVPPPLTGRPVWLITSACAIALVGMLLSLAHLVWPSPLPITLFMIVRQGCFGVALLLDAVVILKGLKRQKVL